jgi:AraC-like DNA-binding protein
MRYLSHTPSPPLRRFVENLWSLSDAPAHARETVVPSGTLEMVFNLGDDRIRVYHCTPDASRCQRLTGAIVSGAYRAPFVIDTRAHESVIGVHFEPGGAWPLLGVPPGELADAHVDLETLWGRPARELRERLIAEPTPARRFRILEEALLARLTAPARSHAAVHAAIDLLGQRGVHVASVAASVELSHRRLIELFTAEVGLTPKLFARLCRFQRAFARATAMGPTDWVELAIDCGYFDQSHMIRDFLAFAGTSPTEILQRPQERVKVNHLAPLDAAR